MSATALAQASNQRASGGGVGEKNAAQKSTTDSTCCVETLAVNSEALVASFAVFRRLFAFTPCTLVPCDLIKAAFTRCQNSGPHHVAAGFVSRCVVVS